MAAKKINVKMLFANGTDSSGATIYTGIALGQTINPETYDDTKALRLIDAVTELIDKAYNGAEKTEVSNLVSVGPEP